MDNSVDFIKINSIRGFSLAFICILIFSCDEGSIKKYPINEIPNESIIHGKNLDFPSSATLKQKKLIFSILKEKEISKSPEILDITYPLDSSVFPPDLVPPTFTWNNVGLKGEMWLIEFQFGLDKILRVLKRRTGPPKPIIDSNAIPNNAPLNLPHNPMLETWTPTDKIWNYVKSQSLEKYITTRISGISNHPNNKWLVSGVVKFKTSKDSIGAPIFYRDVPFMPILNDKKGVILPLDNFNKKFINWRLRDLKQQESKVVLKDMPTCANCHTFSKDGKWLGMDIDGTQGDKGAYGIQKVSKKMSYKRENIISWNYDYKENKSIKTTFGFLSSISPQGNYVVTTINEELFIVGYIDQAFLQVFYPTKGILAYYSQENDVVKSLPGANDTNYVHCSPTWTPDGKTIIFSRAKAKSPFIKNQKMPAKANDPEETPIQYDLYKMPFNHGRGGKAVPIKGASFNGKSNSFSKVTPDGKFLVWVKCRNGLLMRPDSKLWIMPVNGGSPRLMKCNTWRMNSWHSFSPNSRWMVFSSKKNTKYTQLFLTHIDENGFDTPPILIPKSTADNRASNLPEFANIKYKELDSIEVPAVSHFRYRLKANKFIEEGVFPEKAIALLRKGLEEEKTDVLMRADMMVTIGDLLDDPNESINMLKNAIKEDSNFANAYFILGSKLESVGKELEAIKSYNKSINKRPDNYLAMIQLCKIYMTSKNKKIKNIDMAIEIAEKANNVSYYQKAYILQNLARAYSEKMNFKKAIEYAELGIQRALEKKNNERVKKIQNELRAYKINRNFVSLILEE